MHRKGINYDTGFAPIGDRLSRETFEPAQVRREMEIIARDLHCNAVRISGRDSDRIALAAEYALAAGLEVWFAPFPCNMTPDELVPYFVASAQAAEKLRKQSPQVVFVLGCEMSLFNSGFIPGAHHLERIQTMMNPALLASLSVSPEELLQRFNAFLARAVAAAREHFAGPVTYASGPWENVDWTPFDIVSVDYYRDAGNHSTYREQLRPYFAHNRPVVVTEFGCCTYQGAQHRGSMGWAIIDRAAQPPRLTEAVIRDEQVQADYLMEVLRILDEEGVDGAFWFTFAAYGNPHHADPRYDLDCASYGVVKILDGATGETYPAMPWEPKQSFYALANAYSG
ncbi:MAG: abortive infection protein [Ktedonobacterales bacterium]